MPPLLDTYKTNSPWCQDSNASSFAIDGSKLGGLEEIGLAKNLVFLAKLCHFCNKTTFREQYKYDFIISPR